jgi:hypothetical protein
LPDHLTKTINAAGIAILSAFYRFALVARCGVSLGCRVQGVHHRSSL